MRSKMEYVQEKDANGRTVIRKVGMAPIQRAGMEYEFTLVGDMDLDHNIMISKSRCPQLADAVERKPGREFFNIFKKWLEDGTTPKLTSTTSKNQVPNSSTLTAQETKVPALTQNQSFSDNPEQPSAESASQPKIEGFESQIDPHFATLSPRFGGSLEGAGSELTFEEACAVRNSRNQHYGDLDSNILKYMSGSIYKALKDPQHTEAEREDYNRKLNAIDVILKHR
jgi:hypothetical protein